MRATWNQLKLFAAVARHGSFTRAADELHVVQSTVSTQIRQLTETVGVALFEQIGKKIYLTAAGRELQRTCRELEDTWDRFEMTIAEFQGLTRGRLSVSIVTTAKYFIPRLLGAFCQHFPDVEVALNVLNRDQVVERFVANLDDLYIMGVPPDSLPVARHDLLGNPLLAIAPAGHELAGQPAVSLERFAAERLILRERGSGTRIAVERLFERHGLGLRLRMELGSNEAIKWAVSGGLGLAVLSEHALLNDPMPEKLAVLDVQGMPIDARWYVCWPEGKQLSPVARTFFDYLKDEAAIIEDELAVRNASWQRRD